MSKLVVLYKKPADPAHFEQHFRTVHAPLAATMPGLRSHSFGPTKGLDGSDAEYFWMFVGTFDSLEAIHAAFASSEGKATVADIPNYYSGAPTILYLEG